MNYKCCETMEIIHESYYYVCQNCGQVQDYYIIDQVPHEKHFIYNFYPYLKAKITESCSHLSFMKKIKVTNTVEIIKKQLNKKKIWLPYNFIIHKALIFNGFKSNIKYSKYKNKIFKYLKNWKSIEL